jgi:CIC family chloride channel protein
MQDERATWLRLTLLGVVSGILAGCGVIAFRGAVELGQLWLLPIGSVGNYESLSPWLCLALPTGAGLLLGLIFDRLPAAMRQVGVTHVLKVLQAPGQQRLRARNMFTQFFGAVVAIVGGHSVDREGPAVHIGAASASLVGRGLRTDTQEDITLTACGAAAAIAAAFDTPLAGVIFAIEVLRIRYEVGRFLPVIVAAVVGAVTARLLPLAPLGYVVQPEHLVSVWDYPSMVLLGACTAGLAVAFIGLSERVALRTRHWHNVSAFALAGLITGIIALWRPEIMGTSYDTLDQLLAGQGSLLLVASLVVTKLVATGCAVGLRIPGGLIGPTLFIGGAAGSALGMALALLAPEQSASPAFYATVGMVAMMGATLRAPLAALTALLELTANPNIILPGMIAVASAELITRLIRGRQSVFDVLLAVQTRAELPR